MTVTQDFIKGVELADGQTYDATVLNNLVDQSYPHPSRGLILVTQDTGTTPDVPDPGTDPDGQTYRFKRYTWRRLDENGTPTDYVWDDNADEDATLLKWVLLVSNSTLTAESFPAGVVPAGALADNSVLGRNLALAVAGPGLQIVSNQLTVKPDNSTIKINSITGAVYAVAPAIYAPPIGMTFWSPVAMDAAMAALGWLPLKGAALSRTTYAELFAIYGTTFGAPSGTEFSLPDLSGRFPFGANGTHAAGATYDSEQVELVEDNIPQHTHLTVTVKNWDSNTPLNDGTPVKDATTKPASDNYIQSCGGTADGSYNAGDSNREYVLNATDDEANVGLTSGGSGTAAGIDIPLPPLMAGVWYVYAKTP